MGIQCSISAEASVLVYAKNEKAAHASILRDMKCYEGNRVHRSDSNGWNGWHLADDVEILSIEQDRHGKPLRHKFEIRSEEHTSELQSLMRISYAVFCLKKKNTISKNSSLQLNTLMSPTLPTY